MGKRTGYGFDGKYKFRNICGEEDFVDILKKEGKFGARCRCCKRINCGECVERLPSKFDSQMDGYCIHMDILDIDEPCKSCFLPAPTNYVGDEQFDGEVY